MERPRDGLIRILQERGASSVAELAAEIGVSEGSVRRHLDIILADGLVDTALDRSARGRPVTRYSLSEAGEEQSSHGNYSRLLDRLYPALSGLPEEDVSGQSGEVILERVFEHIARLVAREHVVRVTGESIDERVGQVADVLRDEGILSEVVDEGEAFRLRNIGCPYRSAAEENHAACAADRRTIELLVGVPVEQVTTIADGAMSCDYLVSKDCEPLPEQIALG
jgi:predicted ArsR family transcriptional regulator